MKARTTLMTLAVLGLAVSSPATAQDGSASGRFTVLLEQENTLLVMDTHSLRREGNIAHVSSYIALDTPTMQATSNLAYMQMFNQFDCARGLKRTVSGTGYGVDGTERGATPGTQEWSALDPTSPNGEMFAFGCRGERPRGEAVVGTSPHVVAAAFRLRARQ